MSALVVVLILTAMFAAFVAWGLFHSQRVRPLYKLGGYSWHDYPQHRLYFCDDPTCSCNGVEVKGHRGLCQGLKWPDPPPVGPFYRGRKFDSSEPELANAEALRWEDDDGPCAVRQRIGDLGRA